MRVRLRFKKFMATILIAAMSIALIPMVFGDDTVLADGTITSVVIDNVTLPKKGEKPTTVGITTNASSEGYEIYDIQWFDENNSTAFEAFEEGKTYRLSIKMQNSSSAVFPNNVKNDVAVTVNGKNYVSEDSEQPGTACWWKTISPKTGMILWVYYKVPGYNCAVYYYENGGSGSMDMMQVEVNNELTLPNCSFNPPDSTKEFIAWKVTGYTANYLPGEKVKITQATTVTAIWGDVQTFKINFNMNGHGTSSSPITGIPRNSKVVDYLPIVSNDGDWIFGGWFKDADFQQPVEENDKITSNMDIYARWYKSVKAVTIGGVTEPVAGGTPTVSGITTNASSEGYEIYDIQWLDENSCAFEAFEEGKTYRLSIRLKNTSSVVFPNNVKNNVVVTVNGKKYASEDSEQPGTACWWETISPNTGMTLWVYYKVPSNVSISFNSNGGSSVTNQTITEGSKAKKPADPIKSGYTFGGWFTDSACTNSYDFDTVVTGNITLYAKWTAATTTSAPSTPAPETTTPDPVETPKLTSGVAHVQDIGNVTVYADSDGVLTLGTTGQSKRIEEITINFENNTPYSGTLEYRVHVQDKGWMEWVPAGTKCGTEGLSLRIEAIEIRLTGELAEYYSVEYCVHIQDYGDMQGWVHDGALAGTTGESKRIEQLKINIVPKGIDETTAVMYRVHVQDYGWEKSYACNGAMSGTSGESKRLEGIELFLSGVQYSGGIKYKTHVQDYGWQGWCYDGEMSGTQGESKRLEGICIELYGEIANYYDIYYRVHAQDIGWMGWAKNGECAGTAGRSARLEGIQIVLVPKGSPAPDTYYDGISSVTEKSFVEGF